MAFERDKFKPFTGMLRTMAGGADMEMRCKAENFLLEERLNGAREDSYEKHLETPIDKGEWEDRHNNYISVNIHHAGTPETFTGMNQPNLLPTVEPDQLLVRLEKADRLPRLHGETLDQLMTLFREFIKDRRNPAHENQVKAIFSGWNRKRDTRPSFVGFWGEVKDIFEDETGKPLENKDWADRLRDRFGLGHLDPEEGEPIPVLMFRYRAGEVVSFHGGNPEVLAVPTVLDGELHEFFCPTPQKGWNEGQSLDLSPGDENDYKLNREILHRAIAYKPEFLYNAGWITTSPGKTLERARGIHLEYLLDDFRYKAEVKGYTN